MQQHCWRVWIAPESIRPGERWVEAIQQGLVSSGVFIALFTSNAMQSDWVKKETDKALLLAAQGKLRFIPIELELCNIPDSWGEYHRLNIRTESVQADLRVLLRELDRVSHRPRLRYLGQRYWWGIIVLIVILLTAGAATTVNLGIVPVLTLPATAEPTTTALSNPTPISKEWLLCVTSPNYEFCSPDSQENSNASLMYDANTVEDECVLYVGKVRSDATLFSGPTNNSTKGSINRGEIVYLCNSAGSRYLVSLACCYITGIPSDWIEISDIEPQFKGAFPMHFPSTSTPK